METRWWTLGGLLGLALLVVTAVNCGTGGGSGTGTASDQQTGDTSQTPGTGSNGSATVSDYADEAERVARVLWDSASDEAAVEAAILDAFRALGLGVYDADGNPVLEGSGSPSAGGTYLRDYEVTLLARAFVRFRENWADLRIPLDGILNWNDDPNVLEITLYDSACNEVPLTVENVRMILQNQYAARQLAGMADRDYFLGNLLTELEIQNPNKPVLPTEMPTFDDLDPLQAFLIILDWVADEPLVSGITQAVSVCGLIPGLTREAERTAPDVVGALNGVWGWARKAQSVVSKVTNPINLLRAEMIVYGTKIRVTGPDEPMHYRHTDSPFEGRYEITATVEFIDDYGATLSGTVVPEKGPIAGAYVRFETDDLETHGTVLDGVLGTWPGLLWPAWDADTDQNGQASFIFQTRLEDPIGELDSVAPTHIWAYANPLSPTYWHGQVAMLLFPIQEIAYFEVSWHEVVCGVP